jgi:hypothetical protein
MTTQSDEMNPEKCAWHGCGHRAARALVAVIVLIFVFWCGFEFGEIRAQFSSVRGGYGYGMMGGWNGIGNDGSYGTYGGYGPGMMGWGYHGADATAAQPAPAASATAKK